LYCTRLKLAKTLPYQEESVSFVGEDGDPLGLSACLQSVDTDFRTCLDMIEEVIKHWPSVEKKQRKAHKANANVSIM